MIMYQEHSSEIKGLPLDSIMRAVVVHPLLLLILFLISSPSSVARETITTTQPLHDNETLISSDGSFALGFFTPSGSNKRYVGLWYNKIRVRTVVWVANRRNPVTNSTGVLSLSANGSLLIADQNNDVVWSSNTTTGVSNPVAQLLDTGNLVVREVDGNGDFAWEGFHYPTDTLIAGMKLGVDLVTGLNRTLTAWTSDSDPWPSQYYLMMDTSGDPELLLCEGSRRIWRSGPWNGLRYSGIPDTLTYDGFTFSFINNKQEMTYSFVTNKTIVSRLVANHSGLVQRSLWVEAGGFWNYFWYAPRDQCDFLSPCGPYGACNPNSSPICDCLRGFTPKSPYEWALRDGSDGCVRKTPLDCKNGTDGFLVLQNTKLPDTTASTLDTSLSLDECRAKCLSSCTCTAYAPADVRNGGSGCVIWATELTDLRVYNDAGGQDLYVRLAVADLGPPPSRVRKSKTAAIAALIIILVVGTLLIACVGCLIWRRRRTKRARAPPVTNSSHDLSSNVVDRSSELELPLFDLAAIAAATDNFSNANKLGEGGFGPVYKGTLGDGREIAVKRLAKTSVQGIDEFKNEVMLIAKLQHRNLVRLVGCCIEREETALVYEYMPNKSLDIFLFDRSRGTALDWQRRYQIIMGIARGLLYLHQDSRLRIIHRDLKASNILLDNDMNPRISDFGLARIFGGDEAEANTIKVVGTYGYMSPEYAMDGIFSQKSDVFSFGVLVLEIICGKRNRGDYFGAPHVNLLSHAWSLWSEGNTLQIVDEALGYSYPMNEVMRCIKVGLLCVQEHPEDRPLMSSVVFMLSSDNAPLPFPNKPGFVTRRVVLEMDSSSSNQRLSSAIDITDPMFEGR